VSGGRRRRERGRRADDPRVAGHSQGARGLVAASFGKKAQPVYVFVKHSPESLWYSRDGAVGEDVPVSERDLMGYLVNVWRFERRDDATGEASISWSERTRITSFSRGFQRTSPAHFWLGYMVNAYCADAVVCIFNYPKIALGVPIAALHLNFHAVFVSGGSMEAGEILLKDTRNSFSLFPIRRQNSCSRLWKGAQERSRGLDIV